MGDSQTGEQLYHRSPPTEVSEGSESHVRLPNLGVWQWEGEFPENQTLKASRIWLQDFDRNGGNRDSSLGGHTQSSVRIGTQGKEQWPRGRLNQTYLLVLEALLHRRGVALSHCGDKDTGSRRSGKYSLAWALPESTISTTKEPVGSSAGLPQAKQPTGREPSPTHHQTSWLKFYWALPTRATPRSTHHQSFPSGNLQKPLTASCTRGQTAEARRTPILQAVEWKPHSQKDRQNEKAEDYVPDEGTR